MDHEVHINNGSRQSRPIIFHLLPGEETIFNLKVINHGPPTNISLQASSPVFKAVRLKKPDHHVIAEEVIPILARMPADRMRLDGEIILSADGMERRVPISLLSESDDPVDDLNDSPLAEEEDLAEDVLEEDMNGEGEEGSEDDKEYEDDSSRRDRLAREDEAEGDGSQRKQNSRISFSMDADLKRHRSARGRKRQGGASGGHEDGALDVEEERPSMPRYRSRIDDSFVDKSHGGEDHPYGWPRGDTNSGRALAQREPPEMGEEMDEAAEQRRDNGIGEPEEEQTFSDRDLTWPGYLQEADSESREIIHQAERDERYLQEEREGMAEGNEDEDRQEDGGEWHSFRFAPLARTAGVTLTGSIQAVPVLILLTLIAVLVITFVTGTIPEFSGALASSILMVTLIIYGAAKLLKT